MSYNLLACNVTLYSLGLRAKLIAGKLIVRRKLVTIKYFRINFHAVYINCSHRSVFFLGHKKLTLPEHNTVSQFDKCNMKGQLLYLDNVFIVSQYFIVSSSNFYGKWSRVVQHSSCKY